MSTQLVYIANHEAWYWSPLANPEGHSVSITIQREALTDEGEHDGCIWEFKVTWHMLPGGRNSTSRAAVPRIEMFDDAWQSLTDPEMAAFFRTLAEWDSQNVSPEKFKLLLSGLGFTDRTERVRP